jgi:hypothetical protein
MRALVTAAAALAALVLGCVPASLDLSNRRCPCAAGWTCDVARDRCVQGPISDAAGIDAAMDAAMPADDAAGHDAAGEDAARPDTGADAFAANDAFTGDDAHALDVGTDAANGDGGMHGDTGCTGALSTALVCDGFETDPGPWSGRNESGGSVMTDGTLAQRGTRSLHAATTVAGGNADRELVPIGPFTTGDLWARASIYLPSSAVVSNFTWLYIGESIAPYAGVSLGMGGDGAAGAYSQISLTYTSDSTLVVPRDRWTCLELHVHLSDTAGTVEIYIDGTLGSSSTGIDTNPATGFTQFLAGIDYTDATQAPLEIWLDEVALSRSRLACP